MICAGRLPRSKKSGNLTRPEIRPLSRPVADLLEIVQEYCGRYSNPHTREDYRRALLGLFRHSGRQHPSELTESDLLAWCTSNVSGKHPANNTIRLRASRAGTFLRWCLRSGIVDYNAAEYLGSYESPLRTFAVTYGKVQAKNPGRWLTHDQAYGQLVGTCQDGTLIGLRDEIIVRLGLLGMRLSEIRNLTLDDLRQLPTITWTGKGHKPRQATAGGSLVDAIRRYLAAYPDQTPASPLIVRQVLGAARQAGPRRLDWGHIAANRTLFYAVNERAKQAGLGHVAPHDLRRTAAGILHRAVTDQGAHHFDLLDIQKVLGHANPATTVASYLAPMQTEVLDRAAAFLD